MASRSLRRKNTEEKYAAYLAGKGDIPAFADWKERLVKEFGHWLIIENSFPADRIAEVHHLLIPKRVFPDYVDMTEEEYKELLSIKQQIQDDYDFILENFPRKRTIPQHFHMQLFVLREHDWEWEKNEFGE